MLTVKIISFYSVFNGRRLARGGLRGKMNDGCGRFLQGSHQREVQGVTAGILKRFISAAIAVFTFCLTSALFQLVLTHLNTRTSYCVRHINLNTIRSEFLLTEDRQALGPKILSFFSFFFE